MAYVFVTREDVTEVLNEKIWEIYPGNHFDFSGRNLPPDVESLIHNRGLCVEAVYTQADSGDWGTFLHAEKDFEVPEPNEDSSDEEWQAHEATIEALGAAIHEWLVQFDAEIEQFLP